MKDDLLLLLRGLPNREAEKKAGSVAGLAIELEARVMAPKDFTTDHETNTVAFGERLDRRRAEVARWLLPLSSVG